MLSIILIPLLAIIVLIGLISLISGVATQNKETKGCFLWVGKIMIATPFVLMILAELVAITGHLEFVGIYSGISDKGHVVVLELNRNKSFEMITTKLNECDIVVKGTWEYLQVDDDRLELRTKNDYASANFIENKVYFLDTLSMGCLQGEKLELKRAK